MQVLKILFAALVVVMATTTPSFARRGVHSPYFRPEPNVIYHYGSFCGPQYPRFEPGMTRQQRIARIRSIQPVDEIDRACKVHDLCYEQQGHDEIRCDFLIVQGLHTLRLNTTRACASLASEIILGIWSWKSSRRFVGMSEKEFREFLRDPEMSTESREHQTRQLSRRIEGFFDQLGLAARREDYPDAPGHCTTTSPFDYVSNGVDVDALSEANARPKPLILVENADMGYGMKLTRFLCGESGGQLTPGAQPLGDEDCGGVARKYIKLWLDILRAGEARAATAPSINAARVVTLDTPGLPRVTGYRSGRERCFFTVTERAGDPVFGQQASDMTSRAVSPEIKEAVKNAAARIATWIENDSGQCAGTTKVRAVQPAIVGRGLMGFVANQVADEIRLDGGGWIIPVSFESPIEAAQSRVYYFEIRRGLGRELMGNGEKLSILHYLVAPQSEKPGFAGLAEDIDAFSRPIR